MLDLAQKSIGVIKHAIFEIGQATGFFQGAHRFERIRLPNLGQIAAVGELQKLNRKFDVANAAVTGLDFRIAFAILSRLEFDLAFERLDLVDFGNA